MVDGFYGVGICGGVVLSEGNGIGFVDECVVCGFFCGFYFLDVFGVCYLLIFV